MSTTVAIPFRLDPTGGVAIVTDDDKALSDRVRALVATVPGERLMRSDYGVPTPDALFDPLIDELVFAELRQMAAQAIRRWEPAAVVVDIKPVLNQDQATVAMDVRVGRADMPGAELTRTRRVLVTAGGQTLDAGN